MLFRFRTYFPDAYKKHYPNAKTHLSSKIRSTFPDGTSLFEKTRSKRRRPFTEAEDRALKAGYEKHGTTWAAIVKDPVFQEQNRRSTDLRDRFRNAFPHLYQAAGYKPRSASKKKQEGPIRAADDQTAGPVRSRRRSKSSQGLLRGGTKSVPQSTACSEDEGSTDEEEDSSFKKPPTPVFVDNMSTMSPFRMMKRSSPSSDASTSAGPSSAPTPATPASAALVEPYTEGDDEMELITIETDSLNIPDFMPNDTHSDMETWSSGINTPTHSSTAAWSTAAASPTSSHVSDFLMSAGMSNNPSNSSSPFIQRRNDVLGNNLIGKSAWGQDWFSPNPRLDASSASSNSSSSFIDASFSPSSPFSFHPHLNHGVLDRYDLFPPSMPNDISSDAGLGDSHNSFNDERGAGGSGGASAGGTGFKGYHSQIAGDLISGAGRVHQQPFSSMYSGLPFGSTFSGTGNEISGLGLQGIPEDTGIHPMQLHSHTSSFSAIEELGLTGISLNDHPDSNVGSSMTSGSHSVSPSDHMEDDSMDGLLDLNYNQRSAEKHQQQDKNDRETSDSFDLEDLVDMSNELHATPPATPLLTQPRPLRRSSGSMLHNFESPGMSSGHARSISVPPSEARNGSGGNAGAPMAMDDVGLHMHSHSHSLSYSGQGQNHAHSQSDLNLGKGLQALFAAPSSLHVPSSSRSFSGFSNSQRHSRNTEPMRLTNSTGSMQPPMSPPMRHQQHQQQHHPQQQQQSPQPPTVFPAHLMLSSTSSSAIAPPVPSHSQTDNRALNHNPNDPWRLSSSSATWMNPNTISSSDLYSSVPYLDLHYTTYGSMSGGGPNGMSLGNLDATLDDHSGARQGQALDLAQSAVLASSGLNFSSFALGLALGTKAEVALSSTGTIRASQLPGLTNKQHAPPSDTFASVAAVLAAAAAVGEGNAAIGGGVTGPFDPHANASNTGTIRQSHFRQNGSGSSGGLGRSMSHHRGQSAVCPQDLMLRHDNNKRKRASWDGGLA